MLSDEAKDLRKTMLAISAIMAAILVFGISLPAFSLLGFKVSATQRQILALLTIGNIYTTIHFHLVTTRDMNRWLAISDSESYRKEVAPAVLAAHNEALSALGDVTRLSKPATARLVQLFQILRMALVFGEKEKLQGDVTGQDKTPDAPLPAVSPTIPASPMELDPGFVAPLQAEAQSIIWQLQQVDPVRAARIEAALFAMLQARSGYFTARRDSALTRWHMGWSIAYMPVLASGILGVASFAAMVRPDWAAHFANWMTAGYEPSLKPAGLPIPEAKP